MRPQVARRRALRRAARAWLASRPHQAWEIIHAAGMDDHWPTFQREAFRTARARYLERIKRPV